MPWVKLRSCFPLVFCLFPRENQDWLHRQWPLPRHWNSSCVACCVLSHLPISAIVSPFLPFPLHLWADGSSSRTEGLLQTPLSVSLAASYMLSSRFGTRFSFHWEEKPQPKAKQTIFFLILKARILKELCRLMHTQRSFKKKTLGTAIRNSVEMGRTSVSLCNFVFVFLQTKGTVVLCCSEILS